MHTFGTCPKCGCSLISKQHIPCTIKPSYYCKECNGWVENKLCEHIGAPIGKDQMTHNKRVQERRKRQKLVLRNRRSSKFVYPEKIKEISEMLGVPHQVLEQMVREHGEDRRGGQEQQD